MSATKVNLVIEQGTTFSQNLVVANTYNLANATANADIRKYYTSDDFTKFECIVYPDDLIVNIAISANNTALLDYGRQVWDCKVTLDSGDVIRIAEGIATITPEATY